MKKLLNLLLFAPVIFICCKKEISKSQQMDEELFSARFNNSGNGFGNVSPEMVLRWNEAAVNVVLQSVAKCCKHKLLFPILPSLHLSKAAIMQ